MRDAKKSWYESFIKAFKALILIRFEQGVRYISSFFFIFILENHFLNREKIKELTCIVCFLIAVEDFHRIGDISGSLRPILGS